MLKFKGKCNTKSVHMINPAEMGPDREKLAIYDKINALFTSEVTPEQEDQVEEEFRELVNDLVEIVPSMDDIRFEIMVKVNTAAKGNEEKQKVISESLRRKLHKIVQWAEIEELQTTKPHAKGEKVD